MEENRRKIVGERYNAWRMNIGADMGAVLYVLCRIIKPDVVVEAGVASGVSSAYFLCALEQNRRGQLCSIDLPQGGVLPNVPAEEQAGWIVPDYLRSRWQLILGRSAERLSPLLETMRTIDLFLHDSEHSYENMSWEFETAWARLKNGGVLLSHNIDWNTAFRDFGRKVGAKSYTLANLGGIAKPE